MPCLRHRKSSAVSCDKLARSVIHSSVGTVECFAGCFKHQNHWTSTLRDPCLRLFTKVERDTPLLTGVGPGKLQTVPVLIRFAGFEAEWVRSPETWLAPADTKPVELIYSLARHLFALYGIPRFFDAAWLMGGPIDQVERVWYCHIAKGGNIRTAPRSIPSLTKRAAHRLMQLQSPPGSVSIKKEIRWAQIVTLNENLDYAAHIAWRSRAAVDFSNDAIWLPLFPHGIGPESAMGGTSPRDRLPRWPKPRSSR